MKKAVEDFKLWFIVGLILLIALIAIFYFLSTGLIQNLFLKKLGEIR